MKISVADNVHFALTGVLSLNFQLWINTTDPSKKLIPAEKGREYCSELTRTGITSLDPMHILCSSSGFSCLNFLCQINNEFFFILSEFDAG